MAAAKRGQPVWGKLLSKAASEDLAASVRALSLAFETLPAERADLESLSKAAAAALQSGEAPHVLLGTAAVLATLGSGLSPAALAPLDSDAVHAGLAVAVSAKTPLVVAAAVRCLCGLAGRIQKQEGQAGREERHEKQTRARRAVPQIRAALDAHLKALEVQEAVAQGACALLEQPLTSGNAATLWSALWTLAVHPRKEVSEAAALSLCRLTWQAKALGDNQPSVPSAEVAICTACDEFRAVFQVLARVTARHGASEVPPMAPAQCAGLLELTRALVLLGRSVPQSVGGRRDSKDSKAAGLDDAPLVLPLARLMQSVDLVLTTTFSDSAVALAVLGEARGPLRSLSDVLLHVLDLACVVVEVAGSAALPHAPQVRRWLRILTEVPPATHWRHAHATFAFILTLGEVMPGVLLQAQLLETLVSYCLDVMRSASAAGAPSEAVGAGTPSTRRKRKPSEAFEATPSADGGGEGEVAVPTRQRLDAYASACRVLARLARLGGPMLRQAQVGAVCEELIRTLWVGLVAPAPERGVAGAGNEAAVAARGCQHVCRDAVAMLALLDVVESVHQLPRLGVAPLAPSLRDAFASLLTSVATAHQQRAGWRPPRRGERASAAQSAVPARAMQVRDALLASGPTPAPATGFPPGIAIAWPEAPLASAPEDGEPGAETPAVAATKAPVAPGPAAVAAAVTDAMAAVAAPAPEPASLPAAAQPAAQPTTQPVVKPAAEPVTEPAAVPTVQPTTQPVAKPVAEPVTKPAAQPTAKPAAEPVMQPAAKPAVVPAAKPAEPASAAAAAPNPSAPAPAVGAAEDEAESLRMSLELFPGGDDSPLPDLCMDSPSEGEA